MGPVQKLSPNRLRYVDTYLCLPLQCRHKIFKRKLVCVMQVDHNLHATFTGLLLSKAQVYNLVVACCKLFELVSEQF